MNSDPTGIWCILYRKYQSKDYHVMKLQRADGVLVSAKTYDEVFKFVKYQAAFQFAKNLLMEEPEPKYDATVKRVCRGRGKEFYLSSN
jgi:hypothetical protein